VFNAINFKTIVTPGELLLNDTANFNPVHIVTVKNTGSTVQKYSITHSPAGTANALQPGTIFPQDFPIPLTNNPAEVIIAPSTLLVFPGQEEIFSVTFFPPKGVNASALPIFSGFIQITSATENLHVSYLGLAAALKNQQVVDNTDEFFGFETPAIINGNNDVQDGPETYTFVGDDFPTVLFRLVAGTPALKIDLVDPNIQVATDLKRGLFSGGLFSGWWPGIFRPQGTFGKVKTIGPILEFDWIPRNDDDPTAGFSTISLSPPVFANNTVIPNGNYRLLLRVLKITGDPTNENDYEAYLSPEIGIAVPPS